MSKTFRRIIEGNTLTKREHLDQISRSHITGNEILPTLQTHHVYSTLRRRRSDCFHVISTWNTRGVFVGNYVVSYNKLSPKEFVLRPLFCVFLLMKKCFMIEMSENKSIRSHFCNDHKFRRKWR